MGRRARLSVSSTTRTCRISCGKQRWLVAIPRTFQRIRDMTIWRFSRWHLSDVFNFIGPRMGSLNSPCRASYCSSTKLLSFARKSIVFFCVRILATNRLTNRWTASRRKSALAVASDDLMSQLLKLISAANTR